MYGMLCVFMCFFLSIVLDLIRESITVLNSQTPLVHPSTWISSWEHRLLNLPIPRPTAHNIYSTFPVMRISLCSWLYCTCTRIRSISNCNIRYKKLRLFLPNTCTRVRNYKKEIPITHRTLPRLLHFTLWVVPVALFFFRPTGWYAIIRSHADQLPTMCVEAGTW